MGYRTGLAVLASAHPKPGHPAAPHAWWTAAAPVAVVVCGFIGLGILVWGSRRRPAGQQAEHPRRDTLGWALILAFCVGLSLLMTHVQVSSGLTLVVSAAACVVPSAFALWVTQQNQNRAVGPEPRQEDLAALLKAFFAAAAQVSVRGSAAQEAAGPARHPTLPS